LENKDYDWYILFPNHHEGLRLNKELKGRSIKGIIAPTPREASTSCGISLIVLETDLEIIRQVIAELGITIEKIMPVPKKDWHYRSC
jgi:hypothetical protein